MLHIRRLCPAGSQLLRRLHDASTLAAKSAPSKPAAAASGATASHPAQLAQITCKQKRFTLAHGVRVPTTAKFGTIELASAGWKHHKANGDFFTIHPAAADAAAIGGDAAASIDSLRPSFDAFGLDARIVGNLAAAMSPNSTRSAQSPNAAPDTTRCTAVQASAMPLIMAGDHTLIAAETGCGKTLAYLVPIVQQILQRKRDEAGRNGDGARAMNTPLALVLTPGRELGAYRTVCD